MHNMCCCYCFVQCLWAAIQKNNVSCWTVKHSVSVERLVFSPMTALNKLLKRPRSASGIWRAAETLHHEEFLDSDLESETEIWWHAGREMFNHISFPPYCQREFLPVKERDGLSMVPGLGLHFWGIPEQPHKEWHSRDVSYYLLW